MRWRRKEEKERLEEAKDKNFWKNPESKVDMLVAEISLPWLGIFSLGTMLNIYNVRGEARQLILNARNLEIRYSGKAIKKCVEREDRKDIKEYSHICTAIGTMDSVNKTTLFNLENKIVPLHEYSITRKAMPNERDTGTMRLHDNFAIESIITIPQGVIYLVDYRLEEAIDPSKWYKRYFEILKSSELMTAKLYNGGGFPPVGYGY